MRKDTRIGGGGSVPVRVSFFAFKHYNNSKIYAQKFILSYILHYCYFCATLWTYRKRMKISDEISFFYCIMLFNTKEMEITGDGIGCKTNPNFIFYWDAFGI